MIPDVNNLNNEEIIILSDLAVRLERLEKAVYQAVTVQLDFLTDEILQKKLDDIRWSKKTPWKRIEELENSLKGFIAWYHDREKVVKPDVINKIKMD